MRLHQTGVRVRRARGQMTGQTGTHNVGTRGLAVCTCQDVSTSPCEQSEFLLPFAPSVCPAKSDTSDLGGNPNFSIAVHKEEFGYKHSGHFPYREKSCRLFCFKVQAVSLEPKKLLNSSRSFLETTKGNKLVPAVKCEALLLEFASPEHIRAQCEDAGTPGL